MFFFGNASLLWTFDDFLSFTVRKHENQSVIPVFIHRCIYILMYVQFTRSNRVCFPNRRANGAQMILKKEASIDHTTTTPKGRPAHVPLADRFSTTVVLLACIDC